MNACAASAQAPDSSGCRYIRRTLSLHRSGRMKRQATMIRLVVVYRFDQTAITVM